MNQLTKNVIENCRNLVLLFNVPLPHKNTERAKELLIKTLPDDIYLYIYYQRVSGMPKEGELSLEQIKGLAKWFKVPIDFLIDDKIVTILTRLVEIKKELKGLRSNITTLHFSPRKNINPDIEELFNNEFSFVEEVIFNETNTR